MAITHGRGLPGDARDYGEEADRWLRGRIGTVMGRAWSGGLGDLAPSPRWPRLRPIAPNAAIRFHLALAAIPDDICWLTEDDV